jgi:DNA-binding NtrC family response regulator
MKMSNGFDRSVPAKRPRWMIVDDNEDILWLLRHFATQVSDADNECFLSPYEALTAFATAPESFELVITDLEMPGLSGLTLCQRIHAISPATKILLMTGSEILTVSEALAKGFCGLLRKPFSIQKLRDTLEVVGVGKIPANFPAKARALMPA